MTAAEEKESEAAEAVEVTDEGFASRALRRMSRVSRKCLTSCNFIFILYTDADTNVCLQVNIVLFCSLLDKSVLMFVCVVRIL